MQLTNEFNSDAVTHNQMTQRYFESCGVIVVAAADLHDVWKLPLTSPPYFRLFIYSYMFNDNKNAFAFHVLLCQTALRSERYMLHL
jgi:hypothetical protein